MPRGQLLAGDFDPCAHLVFSRLVHVSDRTCTCVVHAHVRVHVLTCTYTWRPSATVPSALICSTPTQAHCQLYQWLHECPQKILGKWTLRFRSRLGRLDQQCLAFTYPWRTLPGPQTWWQIFLQTMFYLTTLPLILMPLQGFSITV